MFIGNNLSKILVITAAKKYKKQFLFICIGGCWEQGCFKARYWMKPQSKCHIFSPGKNSKVQASISKKKKLYHLKIALQHCFLLRNVQNLIIAVRFA